jgi:hypothetical protein
MGRETATAAPIRARFAVAVFAPLALVALAACGGANDDDQPTALSETTTPAPTEAEGTPACSQARHSVVLDFAGFITDGPDNDMWGPWITGVGDPTPRPGTIELTQAYRDRGYELIYVTTAPAEITIDGVPVPDAAQQWLKDNGYAWDDGATRVIGYNGNQSGGPDAVLSITSELIRLTTTDGVTHDVGYTNNADKAHAMTSGGVPLQRLFMIGEEAGTEGTTAIPGDDLSAHITQVVSPLPPVCTPD